MTAVTDRQAEFVVSVRSFRGREEFQVGMKRSGSCCVCAGARVFLTPSHVQASQPAAVVARSPLAAERLGGWVGLVVVTGWLANRRLVC